MNQAVLKLNSAIESMNFSGLIQTFTPRISRVSNISAKAVGTIATKRTSAQIVSARWRAKASLRIGIGPNKGRLIAEVFKEDRSLSD